MSIYSNKLGCFGKKVNDPGPQNYDRCLLCLSIVSVVLGPAASMSPGWTRRAESWDRGEDSVKDLY